MGEGGVAADAAGEEAVVAEGGEEVLAAVAEGPWVEKITCEATETTGDEDAADPAGGGTG